MFFRQLRISHLPFSLSDFPPSEFQTLIAPAKGLTIPPCPGLGLFVGSPALKTAQFNDPFWVFFFPSLFSFPAGAFTPEIFRFVSVATLSLPFLLSVDPTLLSE